MRFSGSIKKCIRNRLHMEILFIDLTLNSKVTTFTQAVFLSTTLPCIRAVFNWVSNVNRVLLWFCFTSLCDWLKNLAPLSRPIRSKTQTNQSRLARARTFFPALDASNMYLLQVLIGSLDNLCLLWLAGVITLVLVLRHSFENRSILLQKLLF